MKSLRPVWLHGEASLPELLEVLCQQKIILTLIQQSCNSCFKGENTDEKLKQHLATEFFVLGHE